MMMAEHPKAPGEYVLPLGLYTQGSCRQEVATKAEGWTTK